jgi:hypothetical protein
MTDNPLLRTATACAGKGWPVFPCHPGRKVAATRTATTTPPPTATRSASGSLPTRSGTSPSPPARPGRTFWTSPSSIGTVTTTTACGTCARLSCCAAPRPASTRPTAACTFTSTVPASPAAGCPTGTWTSSPKAATSSSPLPRSPDGRIRASTSTASTASWTGTPPSSCWIPAAPARRIPSRQSPRPEHERNPRPPDTAPRGWRLQARPAACYPGSSL